MAYTYEQLHDMTVAQLREIAKGVSHEAVAGHSTMHKDKLLPALCHALGIDAKAHHHAVGVNKTSLKSEIRETQKRRDEALAAGDRKKFKEMLRHIHDLKHKLRRAIV